MYNKETLKEKGIEPDKIKKLAESMDTLPDDNKFKKWIDREASRIRDGVDRNLANWRLWWALDQAYDSPFHQISFTLLKDIISKDYDDDKVASLVEDFGLAHMMVPVLKPDGTAEVDSSGDPVKQLNIPVFLEIFVPLCAAYLKARWSKLFNDRNLIPLYKYEPAYSTQDNRLRCDIITSVVSVMSSQYGYANDEKDSIFQALHYGLSIAFPRESWHQEKQLGLDGKEKVIREGLRFNMPPPERTYYDMSERLCTINSNTGVSFAGYWHITKLGDIKTGDYWNKDKITFGKGVDVIKASPNFFSNIYPCVLKFPDVGSSENENDRENDYQIYASAEDDTAVLLTEHFCVVKPSEVGLGDYEYPVTFRMVMINYDTVAYIEPMYCGIAAYYGYDADSNRAKNSSLTLEVMPFQDQVGNVLTQWICSAKQNLSNAIFYDSDIVPKEAIDTLKNLGEKVVRHRTFINFSSADMRAKTGEVREAFFAPTFQPLPTGEMQQLIRGLLDLLERALQFSPQEIGQAASHEQSATESNIINNNIGNRVQFTGTFIDEGMWAKKKMIYQSFIANADDDILAEISPSYANTVDEFKKLCEKLGIEMVDRAGNNGEKAVVKVPKSKIQALEVDAFVSSRDGSNRINNQAVATAAVQLLTGFSQNPALFAAVGPEQLVELTNKIADLLQLPKDFRLRFNSSTYNEMKNGQNPEAAQQVQEGMKQMAEQINARIQEGEQAAMQAIQEGDQKVAESIAKEVGPVLEQASQRIQGVEQQVAEMDKALQQIGQVMQQAQQQAMP